MPNTYTWTPTTLIGYPEFQGMTDVVVSAFYTVSATDGNHAATNQGTQQFVLDPEAPFIPYDDLTPEIVTGWIQSALGTYGVESTYANLDAQIEVQINPPVTPVSLPLPWVSREKIVQPVIVSKLASSESLPKA